MTDCLTCVFFTHRANRWKVRHYREEGGRGTWLSLKAIVHLPNVCDHDLGPSFYSCQLYPIRLDTPPPFLPPAYDSSSGSRSSGALWWPLGINIKSVRWQSPVPQLRHINYAQPSSTFRDSFNNWRCCYYKSCQATPAAFNPASIYPQRKMSSRRMDLVSFYSPYSW